MVEVYTAQISYGGSDRLDITRAGNDPMGVVFAPSWSLLGPMLKLQDLHDGLAKINGPELVEHLRKHSWSIYEAGYVAQMRLSYQKHRAHWDHVLRARAITLCCYCSHAPRCHRTVLARILKQLGAKVCGERGSEQTSLGAS